MFFGGRGSESSVKLWNRILTIVNYISTLYTGWTPNSEPNACTTTYNFNVDQIYCKVYEHIFHIVHPHPTFIRILICCFQWGSRGFPWPVSTKIVRTLSLHPGRIGWGKLNLVKVDNKLLKERNIVNAQKLLRLCLYLDIGVLIMLYFKQ